MEPDFDIGIIGGGPAGASLAAYLAKAGVKCVVFERELFPRPHVGESLVPSSTRVFNELGFLDQMEEAKFPHKFGAVWTANDQARSYDHDWDGLSPDCHAEVRFAEREQPGVNKNYTYHVDRGKFDLLLLQHANRLGAAVYEGVRVSGVDFSSELPVIRFTMGRKEMGVSVRMVADASGRQTFLGNQLKLKVKDTVFDQYAIHSWFGGVRSQGALQNPTSTAIISTSTSSRSRIAGSGRFRSPMRLPASAWSRRRRTLSGRSRIGKSSSGSRWKAAPALQMRSSGRNAFGGSRKEGDYSYAMSQICGDRFVLVGDAGRFVDPIFSTGVSIALNSSRFAHRDILGALERNDFSRASFKTFEDTITLGTRNWYEFISVYYRLNVLFTYFITDRRYRLDVLKLLQGDVYDDARPPVLDKMRSMVSEVEQNAKHPWHALLGDLTNDAFRPRPEAASQTV